tara:strand:+ start:379 stop:612 length:234 start_codon:yes stop_codon:yes gene_type:complete
MTTEYSILIVVPTLNSYHLLHRLINSLKAQNWKGWRLLFIDGNSSEEHIDWLNESSNNDDRITWIEQDPKKNGYLGR